MSDTISQAFGHPIERAKAMVTGDPCDRISLRDYVTDVDIGAFQLERGQRQRLRFNIVVEVAPIGDPIDDDVDRILSYDLVREAIEFELAAERLNLLETLAERVAARILTQPQAGRTFVRIEKLDRGPGALGVEIVRSRAEVQPVTPKEGGDTLAPQILCLSYAAITHPDLIAALAQYRLADTPLILTCAPSPLALPQSGADMAQRRIVLLALEQAAWVLAGRDARFVVVDSRTEIDWAMKQDQISVWAPSKIVLNAVDGPQPDADVGALTHWLCREIGGRSTGFLDDGPLGLVVKPLALAPILTATLTPTQRTQTTEAGGGE